MLPYHFSVIIACYNEQKTIAVCLDQILALKTSVQKLDIIVVDDCSTDTTITIIKQLAATHPEITLHYQQKNQGKGAAIRAGFAIAQGDVIAFQDADLEYDPQDFIHMLELMHKKNADVILGSRFLASEGIVVFFWHRMINYFLTLFSNMMTNLSLSDMTCCYKMFRRDILLQLPLKENGFAIEAEMVAKLGKLKRQQRHLKIYETRVHYDGRSYAEGKKIHPRHIFPVLYATFRYSIGRLNVK